jgi:hypothetical protein
MLKHANDVRSAVVKLDEMGIDVGPGTLYLAWKDSAVGDIREGPGEDVADRDA